MTLYIEAHSNTWSAVDILAQEVNSEALANVEICGVEAEQPIGIGAQSSCIIGKGCDYEHVATLSW